MPITIKIVIDDNQLGNPRCPNAGRPCFCTGACRRPVGTSPQFTPTEWPPQPWRYQNGDFPNDDKYRNIC